MSQLDAAEEVFELRRHKGVGAGRGWSMPDHIARARAARPPKSEDHGIVISADVVPLTPSPPPEPLPEITNYSTLIAACRLRADQLQVSRLTLDELAGLPSGYVGKLLALKSGKHIGVESLGALLGALRLKLIAVPIDARQRASPGEAQRISSAARSSRRPEEALAAALIGNARTAHQIHHAQRDGYSHTWPSTARHTCMKYA